VVPLRRHGPARRRRLRDLLRARDDMLKVAGKWLAPAEVEGLPQRTSGGGRVRRGGGGGRGWSHQAYAFVVRRPARPSPRRLSRPSSRFSCASGWIPTRSRASSSSSTSSRDPSRQGRSRCAPARGRLDQPGDTLVMKITVIGAGPGGLYFAILMKKAWPARTSTFTSAMSRRRLRLGVCVLGRDPVALRAGRRAELSRHQQELRALGSDRHYSAASSSPRPGTVSRARAAHLSNPARARGRARSP